MKEFEVIPDHSGPPVFALGSATREALEEFVAIVASVRLDPIDLNYDAANIQFARGSLPKNLRQSACVSLRTLRDIIGMARDLQNPPKASDGDGTSSAKVGSGTNQNEAPQ
jgi:hypothetical protein